jgi:hypothetical protein
VAARNRVTPTGEIVAAELRGAWTGNRGILHREQQIVRFHASDLWITCLLEFRGRWREQWQPGHYTHLFFHDEAVSFAAGHRPCAECRRADYTAYRDAWVAGLGGPVPSARDLDRRLHSERIFRGTHRRRLHPMPWDDLPSGVFVLAAEGPVLVLDRVIVPWSLTGYGAARPRPSQGLADVVTPPAAVAVLRAGYPVQIDAAAGRQARPRR